MLRLIKHSPREYENSPLTIVFWESKARSQQVQELLEGKKRAGLTFMVEIVDKAGEFHTYVRACMWSELPFGPQTGVPGLSYQYR